MQSLYKLFLPNLVTGATIKQYRHRQRIPLDDCTALVMHGVVGVDRVLEDGRRITTFLAAKGQLLNIECALKQPAAGQEFIAETTPVAVAIIKPEYFDRALNSLDAEAKLSISQGLMSQLADQRALVLETVEAFAMAKSSERVLWALRRFHRTTEQEDNVVRISRERLAVHTSCRHETVSRDLAKLEQEGKISKTPTSVTLRR